MLANIVRHHKELSRRRSQRVRMLDLLRQQGNVTNLELARISYRYSARIGELRKDHKILCTYVKPGVFMYTYKGAKNEDPEA